MKNSKYFCGLLIGILFATNCFAKDISFQASVDRNKVSLGSAISLNLTFYGTQHMPAPELPEIDGFQSRYRGPSTRMSIVNGKISSSITHTYTLIPTRVGKFKIGSLSFKYKKKSYASKQITIEVVEGNVDESEGTQSLSGEASKLGDNIFLKMYVSKQEVYLNEIIPLTIKLYVSRLAVRDIEYPIFSHNGFSVDKFAKPAQYREVLNGKEYEVIEFKTNIFGIKTDKLVLGPAQLKCNLLVTRRRQRNSSPFDNFWGDDTFGDFFGRKEIYPLSLKAKEIPIMVKDLPEEGKPKDFSGAVGNFIFDFKAEPKEVKIGDPITLKMIIKGRGNFATVTCPTLCPKQYFKIYDPEVKQEDGAKTFEQILMPNTDTVKEIPKISFSYFDPEAKSYHTISKGSVPIKVTKSKKEEGLRIVESSQTALTHVKKEVLGRDIIYIKESPELKRKGVYLYKNRLFLFIQVLPLVIFIFLSIIHKRTEKLRTDLRYARSLRAYKKAKQGIKKAKHLLNREKTREFYDSILKTLKEYLGNKLHIAHGGITSGIVDGVLRHKAMNKEILKTLDDIFKECDIARYALSEQSNDKAEELFQKVKKVIKLLEKERL